MEVQLAHDVLAVAGNRFRTDHQRFADLRVALPLREVREHLLLAGCQRIQRIGQQRLQDKLREEQERAIAEGKKKISRTLNPKSQITSIAELDALIAELQQLRGELKYAHEFELVIGLSDNDDPQES